MSRSFERRSVLQNLLAKVTRWAFILLICILFFSKFPVDARSLFFSRLPQDSNKALVLEVNNTIARELKKGEIHSYQIALISQQYLKVAVESQGIDIAVRIIGSEGKSLIEIDSPNGIQELGQLLLIADKTGIYRLEVQSSKDSKETVRYEVKIEELRAATREDEVRFAAQQEFLAAIKLSSQRTVESLREAAGRYLKLLEQGRTIVDSRMEAAILHRLGEVYYYLGEFKKALDPFLKELPIRRAINDRKGEADTLFNISVLYNILGEKQKALECFNQSLLIRRAIGDRSGEADALNNIGAVYDSLGEKQKALEYFNQSLPISRAVGDRNGEADTLNNIGAAYSSLGEKQKALECFNQSLQISRAVGDRRNEAISLNNIGTVYNSLGEQQKALEYFNQALSIRHAIDDYLQESITLNNIGFVYDALGEKQQALKFYNQALSISRTLGDRRGEATTLNNIGLVYDSLGEKQQALEFYHQSLQIRRAIGNRNGEANSLNNIGLVYRSLGEQQQALEFYHQSLQISRAVGGRRLEATTLNNIGAVYSLLGEQQKALEFYNQSLPIRRTVGDRNGEANTLACLAHAEYDLGNIDKALNNIKDALLIVESLRTKITSQDLRASYFVSVIQYYEFYIDLLMRLHQLHPNEGYDQAAFQASERARARSLLDSLAEARVNIHQGVAPALLEREHSLQQLLSAKIDRRIRLLNGKHTEQQASDAENEIEAISIKLKEVEAQIKTESPHYAELTQPVPLTVEQIQQQLLDTDTLLLEYALGEERSYLWLVTNSSITSFVLPKRAEIEAAARRAYELLTARDKRVENESLRQRRVRAAQTDLRYLKEAAELSRILLEPVAAQLETKRLIIVCDGALQYIPFAGLPKPATNNSQLTITDVNSSARRSGRVNRVHPVKIDYHPLLIDHEIINLPSASTLGILRQKLVADRSPASKTALVLADPVFEATDLRVKVDKQKPNGEQNNSSNISLKELSLTRALDETGVVNPGQPIPRLPYSRREAEVIKNLVPEEQRKLALDFEANYETATSQELSNYRFIHFATHGLLNSKRPELSGLLLSLVDERGEAQPNGMLRLGEIYNLKLSADLVVLSACQTALGKEIKGEGLIGLTRGFMYAGAAQVAASLWKVDDEATAELMKGFYEEMLGAKQLRPAAALRQAQLAMWRRADRRAPYFWAAFILQGAWK